MKLPPRPQLDEGHALFLVGVLCGVVGTLLVGRLVPPEEEPDVRHYRAVRDFVREAFVREVPPEELADMALHGMLQGLDAYSRYYGAREVDELERETGGRYTGVGVILRRPLSEGRVLFCLPGSPAERQGLRVGDRLLQVDGVPLGELGEVELQAALAVDEGEAVHLVVVGRDGAKREHVVRGASLVDPTVRHARMLDPARGVAYVALTAFSRETPREVEGALDRLWRQGMRALVLDLRGNFGGVLTAAVDVARRFVPEGVIVSTEGRGRVELYDAGSDGAVYADLPLVVLVDAGTASASEVLAGALQEHRAAVLCGEPTYGKGMVQTMRRFAEVGAVAKVTTSYYYTPSHVSLERSAGELGIAPDLAIPLTDAERRAIHAFLARYGPPASALADIRAWELEEGATLVEPHPPDPQLDAALALLAGRRPDPVRRAEAP